MALKSTNAVVINTFDHGESDKIVTFYSEAHGKLSGIARGAKRSKKRFVNKLEIFTHLDLQYQESRCSSLVRIDQAELINPYIRLREEYDRYVAASLVCELLLYWTRENDPETELYDLLLWTLDRLTNDREITRTVIFFQSRLFTILGYRPQLDGCVECGSISPNKGPYRFSTGRSGMLCSKCKQGLTGASLPVSINTAKLLHKALELPKEKLDRLHFSAASACEAMNLLRRYGQVLLQRDIHSWSQLPAGPI